MLTATLIVSQRGQPTQEVESGESVTHIGSALDNTVCLEPEPGVGRYHAVVERRGDAYWLTGLDTRSATKVNGTAVVGERRLEDGDRLLLGDSCLVEFYCSEAPTRPAQTDRPSAAYSASAAGSELASAASSATGSAASAASANISSAAARGASSHASAAHATAAPAAAGGGFSPGVKVIAASAVVAGLVVTTVAVALFNPWDNRCRPSARITTPLDGTPLRSATTVRVETAEQQCIRRLSYELDGREVAASSAAPYEATLDPRRLSGFAAGSHVLTVTVETTDGEAVRQPGEVYVALGGADAKRAPAPAPTDATPDDAATEGARPASPVAAADVQAMAERLASQISGKSGYVFEREMTARIHALTGEYAAARAAERAARHRRLIVKAFGDRDVRPLLGFLLALSRSKFDEAPGDEAGGIWRVPPGVARGYEPAVGGGAASAEGQRAAEVAAVYLKDLLGIFEAESFDLAVACYGCTLEEAGALRQRMAGVPAAERRNFWRLRERGLVSPEQAEQVVRFYAAGVVGENPERFGAAGDRSLSSLEY